MIQSKRSSGQLCVNFLICLVSFHWAASAQVIVNSSFEEDTFTEFPGYIRNNKPITGWNATRKAGINPGGGSSPFADNGAIVSGEKVAFIQTKGSISQVIHGLEPGCRYVVRFFENARRRNAPLFSVKMGEITVVPPHIVKPVGGNEPYHSIVSSDFTATASSMLLDFINDTEPDNTVLIDNVSIAKVGEPLIPEEIKENSILVHEGFNPFDLEKVPTKLKTGTTVRTYGESIWFSVLAQKNPGPLDGRLGVSLYYGDNEVLFLGVDKDDSQWRIGGAGGSTGLGGTSAHEKALLVVRIDWNDNGSGLHPDMAYLWVNPAINQPTLSRHRAVTTCARLDQYAFNRIAFHGKNLGTLGKFRMGTTFRSVVSAN